MAVIVGVDYGTKRMGIAVSDETELIATPREVVEVRGPRHAADEVRRVCAENFAAKVVVGMPFNMDGTAGPAAQEVQSFVERLRALLAIPVEPWDERLSTCQAERTLLEADLSRRRRKELRDKMAARTILQSYLDRTPAPPGGRN